MNINKFTERHGDPAHFFFRGQCYDSGLQSKMKCSLCGRQIRFVYLLRNSGDRSVPIGTCCFGVFEKTNPDLHMRLIAAEINLDTSLKAQRQDFLFYGEKAAVSVALQNWRQVKRQAFARIREHKRAHGEWLPKELFDLQQEASTPPGKSLRWFKSHLPVLQEKLKSVEQTSK